MKTTPDSKGVFTLYALLFFFSGCAGLIYEVLWMRQFGLVMGNTTISLSAVLTAFMGGLAIGSYLGGRIADRRYDHLRLYGALEVMIGLYAACIPFLIRSIRPLLAQLYRGDPNGIPLPLARYALALAIMIVPTIFMGATLPLLIKHFTVRGGEIGRRTGLIYGINTIGAMFGAFAAGFFLIPMAGMHATNWSAVSINVIVGLIAFLAGGPNRPPAAAPAPGAGDGGPLAVDFAPLPALARRLALAGIAISGAAAMIYQVCWTRMFALLIGSSTYSFSLVVLANIGGLALGGVMFGRWVDRSRRPMLFFAMLQLAAALAVYCILYFSYLFPLFVLRLLEQHQGSYRVVLFNEFAMVAFILFIPTFVMGGMFPVVARICARNVAEFGRTIGAVYSWNTLGAVTGSFSAALILMELFGLASTMCIAIGMNLSVALLAALGDPSRPAWPRRAAAVLALAASILIVVKKPDWQPAVMTSAPYMADRYSLDAIHGEYFYDTVGSRNIVFYKDGAACTVSVLKSELPSPTVSISVNGKPEASNWPADVPTQLLTGHLGMMLHPGAKDAVVIGLGGGVTLASVLKYDEIQHVDLVEISQSVVDAVNLHFSEMNDHALDDPRVNKIIADGRNHIALTDKTYDLIICEPSNPWMAGISNLFTREFFEMCRERLKPDGLMVGWIHTYNLSYGDVMMVVRTFAESMDYATLWQVTRGDFLLVGSKQPIKLDWSRLASLISRPRIKDHLNRAALGDPRIILSNFIATKEHLESLDVFKQAGINVDDTCRLEWDAPKSFYESSSNPDPSRILQIQESPKAILPPESLAAMDASTRQWLDQILPGRVEGYAALGGLMSMESTGEGLLQLDLAMKLNPYDQILHTDVVDGLAAVGRDSLFRGDALGFSLLKIVMGLYDQMPFAMNPDALATTYHIAEVLAEWTGRNELAAEFGNFLPHLGAWDVFKDFQSSDGYADMVGRKAELIGRLEKQ